MATITDVRAQLPVDLKRKAFSIMALRGMKFSPWCREKLEEFVTDHLVKELLAQQRAAVTEAQQDAPEDMHV